MSRPPPLPLRRQRAVRRGLAYLERVACHPRHLPRFGSGLLYCCAFMASTAGDPVVRAHSRRLALQGWKLWRSLWAGVRAPGSADEVLELLHGHLAAERLGRRLPARRRWLRTHAPRFPASAYFGWDPRSGPPPRHLRERCPCGWDNPRSVARCRNPECLTDLPRLGRHRAWCLALTAAFCAERYGVDLGASYLDVLRSLPDLPDYPGPGRGADAFHDAAYTVTHVVYTLNDYGRHQLDPAWLPREYRFLARHLEHALALDDPDMVGEFLDTLRAFGVPEDHPALEQAMEYLLARQNRDGSWGTPGQGHSYVRFHTTWAVIDGLRDFAWTGPGLSFPHVLPFLQDVARRA